MVTLHRLEYRVPPYTPAEELRPRGEHPFTEEDLSRIGPVITGTAMLWAGSSDGAAALSHTRVPGGGSVLCVTGVPPEVPGAQVGDAGAEGGAGAREGLLGAAVRDVTAYYLPGSAEDLPDAATPIETLGSALWAGATGGRSAAPTGSGWCDDDTLAAFAAENSGLVERFLTDVHRLFVSPAGRQILIAERDPLAVARWVALAGASLTPDHARALTFVLSADDPSAAPHQIIGIGPGARFDRGDETALRHLYRVYDNLDGPGSDPLPDRDDWASVAAQMWSRGVAPRTVYARHPSAAAFAVHPLRDELAPRSSAATSYAAGQQADATSKGTAWGSEDGAPPAAADDWDIPGGAAKPTSQAVSPWAAVTPEQETGTGEGAETAPLAVVPVESAPDPRIEWRDLGAPVTSRPYPQERLDALFTRLGARLPPRPSPAELLAGIAASASGTVEDLAQDTEALRAEVARLLLDELARLKDRHPVEWMDILATLHAVSPPQDRTVAASGDRSSQESRETAAAARITRELLYHRQGGQELTAALRRAASPFVRRVLEQMDRSDPVEKPETLLAFAASPAGEWLADVHDQAPLRLRLVVTGQRLRAEGTVGLRAFRHLADLLPAEDQCEPWMAQLIWWLAWGTGEPDPHEAVDVLGVLPGRLLSRAGLDRRLATRFATHGAPPDSLAELADALLRMAANLTPVQEGIAKVLQLGRHLDRAEVSTLDALDTFKKVSTSVMGPSGLRPWIVGRMAVYLAGSGPADLSAEVVVRALSGALGNELRDAYLTEQLRPHRVERLADLLVSDPDGSALLFTAWDEQSVGDVAAWRAASRRLIDNVFGTALRRLPDDARPSYVERVAAALWGWPGAPAGCGDRWAEFASNHPPEHGGVGPTGGPS